MKQEINNKRRGGFAIWYSVVSMTVLCLFVSLATDYGHMQVTKAQLRRTADAAARFENSPSINSPLKNTAGTAMSNRASAI